MTLSTTLPPRTAIAAWRAMGLALLLTLLTPIASGHAASPPTLAVLGTFFHNDNEGLEPTTDAERARLKRTGEQVVGSGQWGSRRARHV